MCKIHYFLYSQGSCIEWQSPQNYGDDVCTSLLGLRNKLDVFFQSPLFDINVFFIDEIVLFDDSSLSEILKRISVVEDRKIVCPSIYFGFNDIFELNDRQFLFTNGLDYKKINQLDNNIWTYYLQVEKWEELQKKLDSVVKRINNNYNMDLYKLSVTNEYLDFFSRVIKENHLNGGHSSQVIPFVYTSETIEEKKAKEIYVKTFEKIKAQTTTINLKVALIDDYSEQKLKLGDGKAESRNNKKDILEALWDDFVVSNNLQPRVSVDIKPFISADFGSVNKEYYDILLLDYNFNENKSGVSFIEEIQNSTEKINGPFGKHWILPISSFSDAFEDDLHNSGLSYISEKFELSRGADFINTPYRFLHYFCYILFNLINKAAKIDEKKENLLSEILSYRQGKHSNDYQELFFKHMADRSGVDYILNPEGIVKQIFDDKDKVLMARRTLNIYEQLLYNLSFRNFPDNEEIKIFNRILNDI